MAWALSSRVRRSPSTWNGLAGCPSRSSRESPEPTRPPPMPATHGYGTSRQTERLSLWVLLLLQLCLGLIFMAHGAQKLFGAFNGPGLTAFTGSMARLGLPHPELWAWVVALVEFLGGVFIVFGFLTRVAALLIVVEMIGAIVLVNWKNGFFWTKGGMEFPLTLIVIALVLVITGPSPFSIDRATGIERSTT